MLPGSMLTKAHLLNCRFTAPTCTRIVVRNFRVYVLESSLATTEEDASGRDVLCIVSSFQLPLGSLTRCPKGWISGSKRCDVERVAYHHTPCSCLRILIPLYVPIIFLPQTASHADHQRRSDPPVNRENS